MKNRKLSLRAWIEKIGRAEVARLLEVTPMAVTHWKKGSSVPKPKTLLKIYEISRGRVDITSVLMGFRK